MKKPIDILQEQKEKLKRPKDRMPYHIAQIKLICEELENNKTYY